MQGGGFMLVESDKRDGTYFLQPYVDLMSWDVRAVYEFDYDRAIADCKQELGEPIRGADSSSG